MPALTASLPDPALAFSSTPWRERPADPAAPAQPRPQPDRPAPPPPADLARLIGFAELRTDVSLDAWEIGWSAPAPLSAAEARVDALLFAARTAASLIAVAACVAGVAGLLVCLPA